MLTCLFLRQAALIVLGDLVGCKIIMLTESEGSVFLCLGRSVAVSQTLDQCEKVCRQEPESGIVASTLGRIEKPIIGKRYCIGPTPAPCGRASSRSFGLTISSGPERFAYRGSAYANRRNRYSDRVGLSSAG